MSDPHSSSGLRPGLGPGLFSKRGLLRVRWASPDPATLAARLEERLGFTVHRVPIAVTGGPARWWIEFPSGRIEIGPAGGAGERLRVTAPASAPTFPSLADGRLEDLAFDISLDDTSLLDDRPDLQGRHRNGLEDLLAVGWATVDLDRASDSAGHPLEAAGDDPLLGARARFARLGSAGLLLLEPASEGRLAAALARHGEGPAAIYLGAGRGGLERVGEELARRGEWLSPPLDGPFGRSARVGGGPAWGPHLIVCEGRRSETSAAGTIRP